MQFIFLHVRVFLCHMIFSYIWNLSIFIKILCVLGCTKIAKSKFKSRSPCHQHKSIHAHVHICTKTHIAKGPWSFVSCFFCSKILLNHEEWILSVFLPSYNLFDKIKQSKTKKMFIKKKMHQPRNSAENSKLKYKPNMY